MSRTLQVLDDPTSYFTDESLRFATIAAIADPSSPQVGQLWLSTTTSNVLKYADNAATPATHQIGALDITATWLAVQTFGNNISIGGAKVNITSLASGDIVYYNGTNLVNLAIGSTNQVLTVSGGAPSWATSVSGVSSVSNVDSTLTISPTTGAVVASLNLGKANTWTATQTINSATPLILVNGQNVSITVTAQTIGASTLTIPNFAGVADTFAFTTLVQTLSNKTLASPTFSGTSAGTYTLGGTLTINAFTLGGAITGGGNNFTGIGYLQFNAAIADASAAGKLFLSSTTANVLKYYDTQATPVLHQVAVLDIAQTWTALQTLTPGINGQTLQLTDSVDNVGIHIKNTGTGGNEWDIISSGGASGYGQGVLVFTQGGGSGSTILQALRLLAAGNIEIGFKVTKYNAIALVGQGFPSLYGRDNRSGLTAADGAATTLYAVPAGAGQLFRITADIFATAFTSGTATYTITWTQNGGARTLVVTATALNTLGTATDLINPDASTNVTAQLTGTFTATVTVAGLVEQL